MVAYSWIGFGVPDALAQGQWNNSGFNGYNNTLTNGAAYFIRVWEGAARNGNGSTPTNYTYYGDSSVYAITNFDTGLPETFEPVVQPLWTPLPPLALRSYTIGTAASPTQGGSVSGSGVYRPASSGPATPGWLFSMWNDGKTQNPRSCAVPPSNVTFTATFLYYPLNATLGNALNATNLAWQSGGDANWSATSAMSRDGLSAQSGPIAGGQQTWIQTVVNGPGSLLFWWKLSAETSDSLQFSINGQPQS